ncbi:xpot [Symbiodinium sp. CCMP2456]|nr:xpot [Symbiodinium sp. CCMP2456]
MDDLERAIRVIFAQDPSITPSVREEATRYCDGIKAHPDCWILCWERLVQTEVLEVKFWCLQVILQALSSISPVARVELRGKVLSWLREVAGKKQEEVVVKNKVALVYAGLIKFDYPAQWPSAWQDLIGLMDLGLPLVDFFLRVLAIFDQEVVNDDVARSNEDRQRGHQIKHAMRERDVVSLVECWYKILTTLKGAAPHMVRDCLKVTALYVVWIEILTVANDKFLSAVCNLIAEASDSAGEACECLAAIVSKKMPASKKVQMLSELQIFARLEACVHRDGSDHQLLVKQADMINSVGEVTLEAYVDLRVQSDADSARLAQVAWESTNALMPLVFWFFAHKEHQVAVCVEPFLTEFFVKVKSFVADGQKGDMEMAPCHSVSLEQVRPILMQTLQLIIQRTSYPPWFQHNDPNFEDEEQHVAFIEFRRSLTKIYKRIFLVDEQLGFQFVQASVAQLTTNLSGVQPMEVDAVLYLFKEAGETVRQLEQHLQDVAVGLRALGMRILVFHGYSSNGSWQQHKDKRLQKLLSFFNVRLHYIDGPVQLPPFSAEGIHRRLSWWSIKREDSWTKLLAYLHEVFRRDGPFDGVMGYSQGAAVAGGLSAEMLVGHFPGMFRFAIVVCGYLAPTPDLKQLIELLDRQERPSESYIAVLRWRRWKSVDIPEQKSFRLPTLHIMGEADKVTPVRMNLEMASLFADPVLVRHPGGHHLPFATEPIRSLVLFLVPFMEATNASRVLKEVGDGQELCLQCASFRSEGASQNKRWYCEACWALWQSMAPLSSDDEEVGLVTELSLVQQSFYPPRGGPEAALCAAELAKGPLAGCFVQLIECDALVNADHWAVQLALMEVYVKYGKLFALHQELFPRYGQKVLQALLSPRGVRSNNPHLAARACFMFGRFVKLVRVQAAALVAQIHEALQDLLIVQYVPSALLPVQAEVSLTKVAVKGALKADDQANLFEALACLAAASRPEELPAKLEMLLKGPAQNLSEIVTDAAAARAGNDIAGCAGWAGRSIEAIATVSKAFNVSHASTATAWEQVLMIVARILEKFVNQLNREIGLWRAALFLCRRMVEVLGDRFLTVLDTLFPFLYATNDQADLTELTIFAHHLVCQYQKKTQPHLQKWPKLSDVFSGSWSKNLVQRINKIEFSEVLRKYQYPGNIQQLFSELDDDRSGEITMYEIDPAQAAAFLHMAVAVFRPLSKAEVLWSSFRLWCIKTFRSVEELLTRLGNTNEERLKSRLTIKARHSAITEEQFQKRIKEMGWQHGQEKLLFSGLDFDASGKLGRESFRWLEAEFHRIQRKMEAKSRAIHSLRKQQAHEAQEQTMNRFKEYLVKKHGNLVRAWRVVLCSNDVMSIPKTPFLKACALIGFSHEARDLWHVLDKDESGFAALEELDPPSAEALARFKAFLESRFGSVTQGFASLDSDSGKKVSYKQFEKSLLEWGWSGHTKQLFQHLDKSNSKTIEESDFRFLEKWHPHPYFLVEANHAARDEIRDLIGQKYGGHFLKAWKQLLDKDGSNRCSWSEFQAACHRIRYHGDVAGAWRAFDEDLSGYITLNELDSEASATLSNFKSWAWREFGTVRAAFSVFDHDASNSLTFQEFRGNCRIYGYVGNARQLFAALDVNQEGVLSMQETCFLDDWEIDNNSQEERTHLEKRESHIRRIDDTVRKHVQKQARPERLSELSCRSHSKRSLKSDSSIGDDPEFVDESDRSSKVAQVKQTLQMRADLPLIPLYTWPHRRAAEVALLAIRDRERKHWVQEAADDWVFMGQFKELAQDMMLGEVHRPDDGGKRVALTGYLPARIPRLHQTFLRPLAVWQQMPEQSDQLKREKLELGNAMLQLLKEAAQRCPSALLEPMLTNTRHGQEMTSFLLVGLQDAREIKAVLYSASAWAALLEAATSSSEAAAAIASLPIAQLLQRTLWSAARMDYNDIQSQKVLSEAASILRSVMNPRAQPQAQLEQTKEAFQQSLVGALPGLQSEIGPRQLGEVLLQEAPLKDVRTTLQQCMLQWQRALHVLCADQGVALFWDPPASCVHWRPAFAMGWAFVPWLLLISRASGIDKPEGCSDEAWNFVCIGKISCADLANAGVTCTGIGSMGTCSTACASPCCVTTTTTTQTVTATTVTSVTHTETSTSISETVTTTHTLTETSITSTASETSTHTATDTKTITTTATRTMTHTITEISESTEPPSTTTEIEPAAVERLSVRAVVTDVTTYVDYIRDSRIITAYKDVMEDVSGLSEHWIALQMFPGAAGNITVDYILTVPFVEGAGGELVPIVPVEQVQGKLDAVTAESFNTMLKEKVDQAFGAGTHSQKVVSFEQDTSDSGNGSVSSALRLGVPFAGSLASILFMMLALIVGS